MKIRSTGQGCPETIIQGKPLRTGTAAWSTFGPHAIGAERFATVSSGSSFAQVAGAILRKQARVQNPDKAEVPGSSPGRPTSENVSRAVVRYPSGTTFGTTRERPPASSVFYRRSSPSCYPAPGMASLITARIR